MQEEGRWVTINGAHVFVKEGQNPMDAFIRQKGKSEKKQNYSLDVENSWIKYVTPTQKKYFKKALDFAIKNNQNDVQVNRVEFHFDFDKMEVKMGTKNDLTTYKMKK